ncbi:very short patch repair endonuclease [Aliiroseovarius sp. S1339]|uniref:very short patch repair endonuclease n=1 Tax=Aliiroseovarius sp. S1339 TaxID=2936990 RepID=UPI0020BD554A|nr:very short patch repair endonuclease [Aliiroseovarius sp. S1339]MCK8465194.1 very short patch repair endonuclease [Aliiroseovarius sp. S1339]
MADVHNPEARSRNMAAIRGTNSKPELLIRHGLHARGFRYRLHDRKLPGRPDLVLPKYQAVVFVNGCYWHGHDCPLFKWPKTREEFWREKIGGNVERDQRNLAALKAAGWRIACVWECALKGRGKLPREDLIDNIATWLSSDRKEASFRGEDTV